MTEVAGIGAAKLEEIKALLGRAPGHPRPDHLPPGARRLDQPGQRRSTASTGRAPTRSSRRIPTSSACDIWGIGFKTADADRPQARASTRPRPSGSRPISFISWRRTTSRATSSPRAATLLAARGRGAGGRAGRRSRPPWPPCIKQRAVVVEPSRRATRPSTGPSSTRPRKRSCRAIERAVAGRPSRPPSFDIDKVVAEVETRAEAGVLAPPEAGHRARASARRSWSSPAGPAPARRPSSRPSTDVFAQMGQAGPAGRADRPGGQAALRERRARRPRPSTASSSSTPSWARSARRAAIRWRRGARHRRVLDGRPGPDALASSRPSRRRCGSSWSATRTSCPPVGPGNLLRDLIESRPVDVVRLDEIFRQEKRQPDRPERPPDQPGREARSTRRTGDKDADFYFIRQEEEAKVFPDHHEAVSAGASRSRLGLPPAVDPDPGHQPDVQGLRRRRAPEHRAPGAAQPGERGPAGRDPRVPGPGQGHAGPQRLRQGRLQRRHRPHRPRRQGRVPAHRRISTAGRSSTSGTSSTTSPWPTPSRSTRPRAASTRPSSCPS